jgi:hypothetical protein
VLRAARCDPSSARADDRVHRRIPRIGRDSLRPGNVTGDRIVVAMPGRI